MTSLGALGRQYSAGISSIKTISGSPCIMYFISSLNIAGEAEVEISFLEVVRRGGAGARLWFLRTSRRRLRLNAQVGCEALR